LLKEFGVLFRRFLEKVIPVAVGAKHSGSGFSGYKRRLPECFALTGVLSFLEIALILIPKRLIYTQALDFFHATSYLDKVAKAIHP
jgi:hypothetical protein